MQTTIFNAPLREFKTKKAAEKFSNSITVRSYIKESNQSAFDMYNSGKIFQVFETTQPA